MESVVEPVESRRFRGTPGVHVLDAVEVRVSVRAHHLQIAVGIAESQAVDGVRRLALWPRTLHCVPSRGRRALPPGGAGRSPVIPGSTGSTLSTSGFVRRFHHHALVVTCGAAAGSLWTGTAGESKLLIQILQTYVLPAQPGHSVPVQAAGRGVRTASTQRVISIRHGSDPGQGTPQNTLTITTLKEREESVCPI